MVAPTSSRAPLPFTTPLEIDPVRQPRKHHRHARPLFQRQRVPVPDRAEQDAHELARRRNGRIRERPELADCEEDKILPHCAAQAKHQDVPSGLGMRPAKLDGVEAAPARKEKHVCAHVQRAPQVHADHDIPRGRLWVSAIVPEEVNCTRTELPSLLTYILEGADLQQFTSQKPNTKAAPADSKRPTSSGGPNRKIPIRTEFNPFLSALS